MAKHHSIMNKYSFLWLAVVLLSFLSGCSDDDQPDAVEPYLRVVETASFENLSSAATTLTLKVESNVEWQITSEKPWCSFSANNVQGDASVEVTIGENLTGEARSAVLEITSADGVLKEEVHVSQLAEVFAENYHYKLPVIFQVLYVNKADKNQYVEEGHLEMLLDKVNELYRNCGQDLNMEFVLATEDPDGNALAEPGVNRVKWTTSTIDCQAFMDSYKNERYLGLIWDPDRYINILLYNFSDASILGISEFPYTVAPDYLGGCDQWTGGVPTPDQLISPRCVSINNRYIYEDEAPLTPETPDGNANYVAVTIAHELGHYLGLRHVFSENSEGVECIDSDFCDDTPTYNKTAYNNLVNSIGAEGLLEHLDLLIMREDCVRGTEYESTNIMDYAVSYSNRFTAEQRERLRFILEKGAFVPGPKNRSVSNEARRAVSGDLPHRVME